MSRIDLQECIQTDVFRIIREEQNGINRVVYRGRLSL